MKRLGLSFQLNLIFSLVIVFASGLFIFIFNAALNVRFLDQSTDEVERHYAQIKEMVNNDQPIVIYKADYLGFAYAEDGVIISENKDLLVRLPYDELIDDLPTGDIFPIVERNVIIRGYKENNDNYLIAFYDVGLYSKNVKGHTQLYTILAFVNIILLGNIVVWMWSNSILRRLKGLNQTVEDFVSKGIVPDSYEQGFDEITDLSVRINEMIATIKNSEDVKRIMIQNISHDMKTPIAVIQNYAEAIYDEEISVKEAKIILKHSNLLLEKTNKLLELTKLESLTIEKPSDPLNLKMAITKIVKEYYNLTSAKIKLDLDDSAYYINEEHFQSIMTNLLDNACRYVKNEIIITLRNKKLTIYNDGEPIDEEFLPKIFKPYEKGSKGQFGLGLAIVSQTLQKYGYQISVANIKEGVEFKITPRQ